MLFRSGTLWTWGRNEYGQLGQNNKIYTSSPVQVGALTTWSKLSCANTCIGAIKTDGTLWTWGSNDNGQLGQGNAVYRSSPMQVGALTNWSSISAGQAFFLATKTDGTLWAWGAGYSGQLGNEASLVAVYRSSPTQIGALTTWSKIACSTTTCWAVKTDGTAWSWGYNNWGNLGDNAGSAGLAKSSPVSVVGGFTDWSQLSGGGCHSLGIRTNGTAWAWGVGTHGQIGRAHV